MSMFGRKAVLVLGTVLIILAAVADAADPASAAAAAKPTGAHHTFLLPIACTTP